MYQRTKTAKSVQQKLELRDIVFILLEIVACRSYGFYFEHFILSCFSSHIRENSRALKPHPPLTRSPFSEHGEGFFSARSPDGDATGIPRLRVPLPGKAFICTFSRRYAPPSTKRLFRRQSPAPAQARCARRWLIQPPTASTPTVKSTLSGSAWASRQPPSALSSVRSVAAVQPRMPAPR